jgi:hypothetical protein
MGGKSMKKILTVAVLGTLLSIQGCKTLENTIQPNVIYPCTIGCGDERITPPSGYVYYQNRVMKLSEFNRITNQNIVMQ